jgi:hypothetical protein
MPDDDDPSHLHHPIGWLLGFDLDPATVSRDEIERRLKVANDAAWREMTGAVGEAPGERRETRRS